MLRCASTQVHLTATDTRALDERIEARRRANKDTHRADARLSYAPRLHTTLSVVTTVAREQGHRTVSTGSEATICTEDGTTQDLSVPQVHSASSTSRTQFSPKLTSAVVGSAFHRPADSVKARLRRSSHSDQPTRVQGIHSHRYRTSHRRRKTSPSGHAILALDGAADCPAEIQSSASQISDPRGNPQANRPVLVELPSGTDASTSSSSDCRALSSAREQLRNPIHLREHLPLREDTPAFQELVRTRHPFHRPGYHDATPDRLLNPDAPIFTPRLRFGSTVTISDGDSNAEAHSQRVVDAIRVAHAAAVDLRIRSLSEQNVNSAQRQRPRSNAITAFAAPRHAQQLSLSPRLLPPDEGHETQQRRVTETSNLPLPSPNIDRYPALLPQANAAGRPRSNSGRSDASGSHRRAGQRQSAEASSTTPALAPQASDAGRIRPLSPAMSTSSKSTPNFFPKLDAAPNVNGRSSSLSWSHDGNKTLNDRRQPSMVSAASGISDIHAGISERSSSSLHANRGALDAASEFLRFRSSPLDDLTAELSRLSTALGPHQYDGAADEASAGTGKSVRLLNGDPFRPSSSPSRERRSQTPRDTDHVPELERPATDEVGHISGERLRHSPSQPTSIHWPLLPATPVLIQPARAPLGTRSPPKTTHVAFDATATPSNRPRPDTNTLRVAIYNDSTPARLQPQTPADLPRSSRRARNRSDTAIHQPSITVSRAFVPSPPAIPERRVYRNTYPSAASTGGLAVLGSAASASVLPGGSADVARRGDAGRRARENQRSAGDEDENDVEGMAAELEEHRSLWNRRRGVDGLEVTPPREGRFERFLG